MNIAIIGAGISGLVAAYHLHREHRVTVFESSDYVGGHVNTASVEVDGKNFHIDTGFIVFNDWTYPNFIQLLNELNVQTQPTEMSFGVCDDQSGLEYCGHSLNTLFAQRRNLFRPNFYLMVLDIIRFNREAKQLTGEKFNRMTVAQFLKEGKYSKEFENRYLLPMGAAIWSCPTGVFSSFPIRFIAEFYRNHGLLNIGNRPTWRVIQGGSKTYVEALTREFRDRIQLNRPVLNVTRSDKQIDVQTAEGCQSFDHVIFACHSDQALKILADDASGIERELLSKFPYSRNVAVLHTDTDLLPKCRRAWASWNYRTGQDNAPACVTYNMSLLQQIRARQTFCVTLNGESKIDPEKILRRYVYDHPIFTTERAAAQSRHTQVINVNRTSFCGAYWRNGFHEDGVCSALAVVNALTRSNRKEIADPSGAVEENEGSSVVAVASNAGGGTSGAT